MRRKHEAGKRELNLLLHSRGEEDLLRGVTEMSLPWPHIVMCETNLPNKKMSLPDKCYEQHAHYAKRLRMGTQV